MKFIENAYDALYMILDTYRHPFPKYLALTPFMYIYKRIAVTITASLSGTDYRLNLAAGEYDSEKTVKLRCRSNPLSLIFNAL